MFGKLCYSTVNSTIFTIFWKKKFMKNYGEKKKKSYRPCPNSTPIFWILFFYSLTELNEKWPRIFFIYILPLSKFTLPNCKVHIAIFQFVKLTLLVCQIHFAEWPKPHIVKSKLPNPLCQMTKAHIVKSKLPSPHSQDSNSTSGSQFFIYLFIYLSLLIIIIIIIIIFKWITTLWFSWSSIHGIRIWWFFKLYFLEIWRLKILIFFAKLEKKFIIWQNIVPKDKQNPSPRWHC